MNEKKIVNTIIDFPDIPRLDDSKVARDFNTILINALGLLGIMISTMVFYNVFFAYKYGYLHTGHVVISFILWCIIAYASDILIKVVPIRSLKEWVKSERVKP